MTGYRTVIHWRPPTDPRDHQPEPTEHIFETLAEAEHDGQRFGCLAGTTRIEVFSPDGDLQALWDKESAVVHLLNPRYDDYDAHGNGIGEPRYDKSYERSRWQRLGQESKALGKAELAKTIAHLGRGGLFLPPHTSRP